MKRCMILLLAMAFSLNSLAQDTAEEASLSTSNSNFIQSVSGLVQQGGYENEVRGSFYFYVKNVRKLGGSVYVFDDWDNKGIVVVDEEQKFSIDNINFNALSNEIQAQVDGEKVYIFDFNFVDEVYINNRKFKSYKFQGADRVLEVIYSDDSFSILKDYKTSIKKNDPDPLMFKEHKDEYIIKKALYIERNGNMQKFKFSKRNFLNQFDKDTRKDIEKYIKDNKLSFKNPYHMRDIAKYAMSIQS